MKTSRNYRRRNIVIAPNLIQQYDSICNFYKIPNQDTSVVFNLCLDTVARGLGNMIKKQREEASAKEQLNAAAKQQQPVGTGDASQVPASVEGDTSDSVATAPGTPAT